MMNVIIKPMLNIVNNEQAFFIKQWVGAEALVDCLDLMWHAMNLKQAVKKTVSILCQIASSHCEVLPNDEEKPVRERTLQYFFFKMIEHCNQRETSLF